MVSHKVISELEEQYGDPVTRYIDARMGAVMGVRGVMMTVSLVDKGVKEIAQFGEVSQIMLK